MLDGFSEQFFHFLLDDPFGRADTKHYFLVKFIFARSVLSTICLYIRNYPCPLALALSTSSTVIMSTNPKQL